jgi:hypothetical protein
MLLDITNRMDTSAAARAAIENASPSRQLPSSRGEKAPSMVGVQKVSYTHDAMIDYIIANPSVTQRAIARHFGYTEAWVSQVFSSDSFKKKLADRKAELVDPIILDTLNAGFEAVCRQSLDVIQENLNTTRDPKLALAALKVSATAMGFGARNPEQPAVNNWFATMIQNNGGHLSLIKNGAGAAPGSTPPQHPPLASPAPAPVVPSEPTAPAPTLSLIRNQG